MLREKYPFSLFHRPEKSTSSGGNVQILDNYSMRRLKRLFLVFYLLYLTARDGGNAGLEWNTDMLEERNSSNNWNPFSTSFWTSSGIRSNRATKSWIQHAASRLFVVLE